MQVKKKPKKTAKAVPEKSRKKKQPSEDQIKKQPFLKRMLFGEEKPDLSELEAGSTTILDILSPTTVDTKSRDYIIVDDVYHAYLYITGYGYTTTVGTCWLAPLVEAGEGINLSFLVKRQPKEKILSKIAQTTMVNRSRMRDVGDTRQDYEELDSAISSGLYLKDVMNRQGENFYYMHTLIEVTAPDSETLEQRVTEVEKLCVSVDMIARRCDYKNEQAFLSALPILALDPDIERKARRNALTSGVAAAFPFVSYELSDHDGIFLGLNLYNRSPVFLNPYDDYKYTSGNWWIGGSTGAGKTVTLQCLGGRLREQGKRVIIIVPKKGHEFRPLCERLGGLYLRMSPSSKDCPNLMAIRRKSLDSYAKLKNIAARDDSVLADKIAQLIIWFSLKKKDLNEEDKSRLDSSLVEVYKRYGITFDNSTIVDENGNFRTMPILSDWYEILYQEQDTRHLAVVLSRYVTGSAAAMAGRNDIELNNKYIVLDLSGMPDDMIADGTFWATSIAYDLIMNCEDELSALLADELWSLVGATANPQAAGFVLEMVKTIRGLGGIAVTSTQGMQDLFSLEGGSYGKGILDSSRIKLVMQMEEQEARLMEGISDVFNSIRGFNMSVQVAVQSLSQWQEKYPGKEWENQLGSFDMTLYMGCNDMTSAEYFAKKCGKVTISVTNNQFPLAPLFSPIYSTTRPYSQTRSNTQRDLLQPDEFLRLNKFLCIVMFNHYKPAQLYKIMLEELPEYKKLKKCSVFDYVPEWKKREEEGAKHRTAGNRTSAAPPAPQPSPASGKRPDMQPQTSPTEEAAASGSSCGNDNMTPEEIGLVEMTCEAILEGDDPELEELDDPTRIPPGRGI